MDLVWFIITGAAAGCLAGMLGIGGGIIVVPSLAFLLAKLDMPPDIVMHVAASTSLAVMVFTTQASARHHWQRGNLDMSVYKRLALGMIIGTMTGVVLADFLHSAILRLIFGVFLILIAMRIFLLIKPHPERELPNRVGNFFITWIIGLNSGLLGVGGGPLTVPYLMRSNIAMRKAVGTSAMCSFTISVIGTVSAVITGLETPSFTGWSTGYIDWGVVGSIAIPSMLCAPLGVKLSERVPTNILKRLFAVVLLIVGLHMLLP